MEFANWKLGVWSISLSLSHTHFSILLHFFTNLSVIIGRIIIEKTMRSKEVKNRTEGKKMKEPRLVTLPGTGVQATKDRVHKESSCRARASGQVSWKSVQQEVEPSSAQAQVVLTRTSVSSFPGVNYSFHAATTGANCSLSSRGNVILHLSPSSLQDAAAAPSLSDFPLQQTERLTFLPSFLLS